MKKNVAKKKDSVRGRILILMTAALMVLSVPQARAADMWSKAGRGLNNIVFGWAEIFYRPVEMNRNGETWANAIAGGMIKGIGYAVARTLTGVYEVLTFPFPGATQYGPIILPEHVVMENSAD